MHATVGDRIVVHGHRTGDAKREAEVLEVHGENGAPPFVVRWDDDGHIATYYPGPDALVQRAGEEAATPVATDDPLSRDLLQGLVALRADMHRLRAALERVTGAGNALVGEAGASLTRRIAQVECEVAALAAEVKAGRAESVTAVRSALEDGVTTVRTVVDDLRVQASLGAKEAEDAWQEAVKVLTRLREDPTATAETARSVAKDVLARLRAVIA